MNVATRIQPQTVLLTAPTAGRVAFCAPSALCGELEVFAPAETIAVVGGVRVEAPDHGFLLRTFVGDGERVGEGTPIVAYRTV